MIWKRAKKKYFNLTSQVSASLLIQLASFKTQTRQNCLVKSEHYNPCQSLSWEMNLLRFKAYHYLSISSRLKTNWKEQQLTMRSHSRASAMRTSLTYWSIWMKQSTQVESVPSIAPRQCTTHFTSKLAGSSRRRTREKAGRLYDSVGELHTWLRQAAKVKVSKSF